MSIFREYDIRGIADKELTNDQIWCLGRALADKIKEAGDVRCFIGRDVRESSPRLTNALLSGLVSGGIETRVLTPGPTPLAYFLAANSPEDFPTKTAIMITGSHNPPEYNGFKMVVGGTTIHGSSIQELKALCEKYSNEEKSFEESFESFDLEHMYVDFCKKNIKPLKNKIKVVVDAGNGAAGPLALKTYEALGVETIPLFCDFDSTFPNHHPDPTVPKNLEQLIVKVKESGADVGIAYDGDGDRIGAVSRDGKILFGDQLILYFTRDIMKDVKHPTIISEVKSSQVLYDELERMGAKPIIWKTGHSLIKAKLKETKAELAGEMSGHIFFSHRFFGFDDAIYSGARLIEGLDIHHPETLDEFLTTLPKVINTPELRVDCPDNIKFDVVKSFVEKARLQFGKDLLDIDGARIKLHNGWGLLRASNTQPVVVMRFEADTQENLVNIRDTFAALLNEIHPELKVPNV